MSHILSDGFPVLAATLSVIRCNTALTVDRQSVLVGTIFVEFTFFFPVPAFRTAFLLHALNRAMRFFVPVVFRCHCLSVLRGRPKSQFACFLLHRQNSSSKLTRYIPCTVIWVKFLEQGYLLT